MIFIFILSFKSFIFAGVHKDEFSLYDITALDIEKYTIEVFIPLTLSYLVLIIRSHIIKQTFNWKQEFKG